LVDELRLGEWKVVPGVDTVDVLDIPSVMVKQRLQFSDFDGEEIAVFTRKGEREVAAYHKNVGSGKIVVLGLAMGQDYLYQLEVIGKIAGLIGVSGHLSSSNPWLSLVERRSENESFLFVNNYDELQQKAVVYENGTPLFDGEEITLPPRSGAIYVRNYALNSDVTIEYATVEITEMKESADAIELAVQPVGEKGSIKFRIKGNWRTDAGVQAGEDQWVLRDLTEETTIKLERI
jgi:beta-galactosidase